MCDECLVTMKVHVIDFSNASAENALNPLGQRLRQYILLELNVATQSSDVCGVVLYGGKSNFSVGADLTEVVQASFMLEPSLLDVVDALDRSVKPVVAAIRGSCLGGGFEVALSCHHRIAAASPGLQIGLPEVNVGLIPGAGGTQRLPRLLGSVEKALPLIVGGTIVRDAQVALKQGLVDQVAEGDALLSDAIKWATWAGDICSCSDTGKSFLNNLRVSQRNLSSKYTPAKLHVMKRMAQLSVDSARRYNKDNSNPGTSHSDGTLMAMCAIDAVMASADHTPFEECMLLEGQLFTKCLTSLEGRARRHVFFATRAAQKPFIALDDTAGIQNHPLLKNSQQNAVQTAVIGAGTMGCGIALVLLKAGFVVTLVDVDTEAVARGYQAIMKIIQSAHQKKQKNASFDAKADPLLLRLSTTTRMSDLAPCVLVVEAVIESMTIKQSIFQQLDSILVSTEAIIVSNTSTLSIDSMASVLPTSRRARFAGWHFFSPAHVMKLVEIVRGQETSPVTMALLQLLTKRIGKIGVVCGNCDGFIGNRMLKSYTAESALLLVEEGFSVKQVDDAMSRPYFGFALGPFQMADLAGNDIGYNIRKERKWVRPADESRPPAERPERYTELGDIMVSEYGRLGQKVGKGWYDYDINIGKGRVPIRSQEIEQLISSFRSRRQFSRAQQLLLTGRFDAPLSANEVIVTRLLYPMVNEAFKILEEGIAVRPSDIDVVYIYGYGFPVHYGGPMFWADHVVGLEVLLRQLVAWSQQYPDTSYFQPSSLLEECVSQHISVEEYYARFGATKRQGLHSLSIVAFSKL
jgi:3-hydroxyacyl-CoA dehydrogenase/enoyl-CoA hydratase/carnithine racemase